MTNMLIIGLYAILTIWTSSFIFIFRKRLTCMVGMMGAMVLGMTIGLGVGTLLAVWLPGQFFPSVMLSMLIGGVVGVIAGSPISLMAVLDGLLSGVMGGMMGAMLVVMIPESNIAATLKLMAVLSGGIIFMLLLMLQGEVPKEYLKRGSFLMSMPAPMFSTIVLILIMVLQIDNFTTQRLNLVPAPGLLNPNSGSPHNHGNSSGQQNSLEQTDMELVIKAGEFSFTPSKIQIAANEKVTVTLVNSGQEEHDFEIVGTSIHIHAQPGKISSTIVSFQKSGNFTAICTIPGHKEAGMVATVQVGS